jgi:hypothetical protein
MGSYEQKLTSGTIVLAGCITVYASGDMIIHNRRKRAEFRAEQKARYEAAIHAARTAIWKGTASEAQIEFISRDEAEQARIAALTTNKKGIFKRGSEWLFSGLKKEEQNEYMSNSELGSEQETPRGVGNALGQRAAEDATHIKDRAKEAFANEKERQRTGGQLDRLGASVENTTESPKSGGWTSFMTRRS